MNAKRIFAGSVATFALTFGVAGTAAASPGNGQGNGPPGCFFGGPPGQTIVPFDKMVRQIDPALWFPPGEAISACAQAGGGTSVS